MILNSIRSFLIILLIFIIIVDFNIPITIDTPINQLVVAIIVIFLILVVDEIIGFVVGLIFLVIYFKYYQKKINKNSSIFSLSAYSTDVAPKPYSKEPEIPHHYINTSENCTEIPYISNELLKSAQNNIYNEENLKIEIKQNNFYGIEGINNENLEYLPFDNNFANYSELN